MCHYLIPPLFFSIEELCPRIKYPEVLRLTSKDEAGTTIVEDIQRDKSTTKE